MRKKYHPNVEDIEEVRIETGPVAFTAAGNKTPKTGREIKFSLWFLAALALIEKDVGLDKFADHKLNDQRVIRLRKKINAHMVPEVGFGSRVVIRMNDGTEYRDARKKQKGHPENPLTREELEDKFRNSAQIAIGKEKAELLIEKIRSFEQINDVGEIMSLTH